MCFLHIARPATAVKSPEQLFFVIPSILRGVCYPLGRCNRHLVVLSGGFSRGARRGSAGADVGRCPRWISAS